MQAGSACCCGAALALVILSLWPSHAGLLLAVLSHCQDSATLPCCQQPQRTQDAVRSASVLQSCRVRRQPADSGRAGRAQGPSAREARRDVTSFETARAEWSRSDVSIRGKGVGAEGDHGVEVWLG